MTQKHGDYIRQYIRINRSKAIAGDLLRWVVEIKSYTLTLSVADVIYLDDGWDIRILGGSDRGGTLETSRYIFFTFDFRDALPIVYSFKTICLKSMKLIRIIQLINVVQLNPRFQNYMNIFIIFIVIY